MTDPDPNLSIPDDGPADAGPPAVDPSDVALPDAASSTLAADTDTDTDTDGDGDGDGDGDENDDDMPHHAESNEPARGARRVAREHVCGVRFRRAGKVYWFDASPCPNVAAGQKVVVETVRGREMGAIVIAPGQVKDANIGELTPLVRLATEADLASQSDLRLREPDALIESRVLIRRQDLPMKAVMAEYNYDGSRLTIYFTSDEMRVDFRNLVRDLARSLRTRVLLRQIGPRDQAKLVGGIDRCGRELCCTSWMPEFQPISIRMAKNQGLPLNPSEISGVCGKLLCCLAFEDDQYREMRKGLPKVGAKLVSAVGRGKVIDVNALTRKITIYWETGSRVEVDAAAFEEQQERLMKAFGGGEVPAEFLPPDARPAAPVEHGPRRVSMHREEDDAADDAPDSDSPSPVDRPVASAAQPASRPRPPARTQPPERSPTAPTEWPERPTASPRTPEPTHTDAPRDRDPGKIGERRAPDRRPSSRPDRGSRPPQRDDRSSGPPPPGASEPPRQRRPRRRRGGRGAGGGDGAAGAGQGGSEA